VREPRGYARVRHERDLYARRECVGVSEWCRQHECEYGRDYPLNNRSLYTFSYPFLLIFRDFNA